MAYGKDLTGSSSKRNALILTVLLLAVLVLALAFMGKIDLLVGLIRELLIWLFGLVLLVVLVVVWVYKPAGVT
jgi:predicted MFS family arabinose efflux permease